jgi:hypothetical protein
MSTPGPAPQSRTLLFAGAAIVLVGALILAAASVGRPGASPSPSASTSPGPTPSASATESSSPGSPPASPSAPSPSPSPTPPPALAIDARISGQDPFATCQAGGAGRNFPNSEVEPYVVVNPKDPQNIIAAWQQDRWSNGGARGILNAVSHDGGRTWQTTTPAFTTCSAPSGGSSYPRASDPWLAFGADGTAYQTALAVDTGKDRTGVLLSRSTDGGNTWSQPHAVAENTGTRFNDKESVTTDPGDADLVYVVWDRTTGSEELSGGPNQPPRGDIMLARSSDGGTSWEPARVIAQPAGVPVGNVMVVLPDSTLVDVFELVVDSPRGRQASESFIRSEDGGRTWSAPKPIASVIGRELSSPTTGNPIRTGHGLPSVGVDARSGRIVVSWSDSRFAAPGSTSVNLSSSTDGGKTWSAPVKVPSGGPRRIAFTPSVAVTANGTIGVSFYLMLPSADGTLSTDRYVATSHDGLTWSYNRVTKAPFDLRFAPDAFGLFLGDYAGLAAANDQFVAVFATTNQSRRDPTTIVVRSSEATP